MKEALLQYIWLLGNFEMSNLRTTCGQEIVLTHRGYLNTDSGPDFSNGMVKIGPTKWAGNIEIHLKSSQWYEHNHHLDKAYNGVILHVVLEDDKACYREDGTLIPCLVLKERISTKTIEFHQKLMESIQVIPCQDLIQRASYMHVSSTLERALIERLENKFLEIKIDLESNQNDWQETFYKYLISNFGFKTNAAAFKNLGERTPLAYLRKHKDNTLQIEALLFGQSGMLSHSYKDHYPRELKKEYQFLQQKYTLSPMSMTNWKFMRMRPANFPTLRLSQFAHLFHKSEHLFSRVLECKNTDALMNYFNVKANEYWDNHYKFDHLTEHKTPKAIGKSGIENLIINTVAPFVFTYAKSKGDLSMQERALNLLMDIKSEQNRIIKYWKKLNIHSNNAFESQALIQLFNTYCSKKKCLDCGIGRAILKN